MISNQGEVKVSFDVDEPLPPLDAVAKCIDDAWADPKGSALVDIGDRDRILAIWVRDLPVKEVVGHLSNDPAGWTMPAWAWFSQAVDNPDPFRANPYNLPMSADYRAALAESELILAHFVDLGVLEYEGIHGGREVRIRVYRKSGSSHIQARLGERVMDVSDRFVDQILFDFMPLPGVRSMILQMLDQVGDIDEQTPQEEATEWASPTVNATHSFVYPSSPFDSEPVAVSSLGMLEQIGVAVPFDELAAYAESNNEDITLTAVIQRDGNAWKLELVEADSEEYLTRGLNSDN
ncbi:hypothetical protein GCM10009555_015070 [Acrocarpospora macrocephala]